MVILNDDGRIIEANSAMGTVFGVERAGSYSVGQ